MENMEDSGFDSDHKSNQTGLLNVSEKNPRLGIAICSRIIDSCSYFCLYGQYAVWSRLYAQEYFTF